MTVPVARVELTAANLAQLRRETATAVKQISETAAQIKGDLAATVEAAEAARLSMGEASDAAMSEVTAASAKATGEIGIAANTVAAQTLAFESRTTQLEQQRDAAIKQLNDALEGLERRFNAAEASRATQFTDAEQGRSSQFTGVRDAAIAENATLVATIRKTEALAEEVLHLAGGTALSKRWINQARDQRIERLVWLAALATLAIGSVVFTFLNLEDFTAPSGAGFVAAVIYYFPRIPLAVVTITVIGFMIQQASRRSLWEARDRRVANELTALPSLLATLPETAKNDVAQRVADRYLPGPDVLHDEPRHGDQPPAIVSVPGGVYTLLSSLSGTLILAIALLLTLTK